MMNISTLAIDLDLRGSKFVCGTNALDSGNRISTTPSRASRILVVHCILTNEHSRPGDSHFRCIYYIGIGFPD